MLVVGYIGNGKSTNRYHLPFVLHRKDKIKVKTIYNIHIDNPAWEKVPGIIYTDELDQLLDDQEIDLVVVCTRLTGNLHYKYARAILEHNKHCLVEKPFMETSERAREIFALAKEKKLIVQVYQNRRFDSDFLTVQKVIESGKLGELFEVEMSYDYYRPYVPEGVTKFDPNSTFFYGHGCHLIDQVISYFGKPDHVHYDVRQLLGEGRMNDYFDVDFYYGTVKVSIKSSYFRAKQRPCFVVYGKKGYFEKVTRDLQEEHLKLFSAPGKDGFGIDLPAHFGTLIYYDAVGTYHEEKVPSVPGDYGRIYDALYDTIMLDEKKIIDDEQTILQLEIMEKGIERLK